MARRSMIRLAIFLSCALAAAAATANDSVYTKLDLKGCRQEPPDPDDPVGGGVWWCEGHAGRAVRVAEGDLRFLVSFGKDAAGEPAAGETLPAFNRIGPTLEWRLDEGQRPVATILRYFTEGDSGNGQVLVVTRLGGSGQVCHVGYVDAVRNRDANEIARRSLTRLRQALSAAGISRGVTD